MPNRIAGLAIMQIDGVTFPVASDAKYRVSDFNVELLEGQDGLHGTKELPKQGMIGAKLRDQGNFQVAGLAAKRNATVVLQLANGKVISGSNMSRVGDPPEVNSEDATFDIAFEGSVVREN